MRVASRAEHTPCSHLTACHCAHRTYDKIKDAVTIDERWGGCVPPQAPIPACPRPTRCLLPARPLFRHLWLLPLAGFVADTRQLRHRLVLITTSPAFKADPHTANKIVRAPHCLAVGSYLSPPSLAVLPCRGLIRWAVQVKDVVQEKSASVVVKGKNTGSKKE